ncbi:MAG: hypothetical protein LPK20_04190, partial [Halomonas sp.]|nr:hypothetical protein [Halomonas sp.]
GGSFLKLDPSGITIVGAQVKINSGGSPGAGSGQGAAAALLPGGATAEIHEPVDPILHEQLLTAALQGAAVIEICQRLATGDATKVADCALGEACPCR